MGLSHMPLSHVQDTNLPSMHVNVSGISGTFMHGSDKCTTNTEDALLNIPSKSSDANQASSKTAQSAGRSLPVASRSDRPAQRQHECEIETKRAMWTLMRAAKVHQEPPRRSGKTVVTLPSPTNAGRHKRAERNCMHNRANSLSSTRHTEHTEDRPRLGLCRFMM